MAPARKPLIVADVPWLLYRAFFALPKSILGADGTPVNALLGTVNSLLGTIAAYPPRALVACFGAEQARYRVELYPPYHAHRDPMPDALAAQWRLAPALLASFGWTVFDAGELEADDAMSSFAEVERDAGGEALLLTGDRDLYQAVCESVRVIQMRRGDGFALLGEQEVSERLGVAASLVPDLIALRGDPSDGLPGAAGVGAKTASALLREHGSLEAVLAAAAKGIGADITPRLARTLRDSEELLPAFKQIATLQRIEVERPLPRQTDWLAGAQAAAKLGMDGLAKRLRATAQPSSRLTA